MDKKDKEQLKKSLSDYHKEHVNEYWLNSQKNWRAWGSWFSWGSPIGLALFFTIPMIGFGILYWLMHH
ncbi:MAG TPA: hypothetical protein VMT96_00995 [Candidatus Bathyarchaeia archaeon]|nr:hypothetical protein [Candidatus Bathyarchaeia archaeon]